ncbi:hypothetical protein ANN_12819 [Periplaneta americana]|uniref:Uncharacterized protein n=1 Tax=Periplaneta americana TaxID=6978 RepID=A0ABQ8TI72_PERAM|nr:hypothetical protein ANN_12819 [Periplaneta americana]
MTGLCEDSNEPPGSLKATWHNRLRLLPTDPELRSGAGSIPTLADDLVGFYPTKFSTTVRRMSVDVEHSFSAYKFVLTDRRHYFLVEHLEKVLVIYCEDNYGHCPAPWSKASGLGLALRNARWFESSWGKKFSHEISASVWDKCPPSIVMHSGSYGYLKFGAVVKVRQNEKSCPHLGMNPGSSINSLSICQQSEIGSIYILKAREIILNISDEMYERTFKPVLQTKDDFIPRFVCETQQIRARV